MIGLIVFLLTALANAQTAESVDFMRKLGKQALVYENTIDQTKMVVLHSHPELAHAFEALLARGLAFEMPEGGIVLRASVTQGDIDAAIARKGFVLSKEVRQLKVGVIDLQSGQLWQKRINWALGIAIVIVFFMALKNNQDDNEIPTRTNKLQTDFDGVVRTARVPPKRLYNNRASTIKSGEISPPIRKEGAKQ